MFGLKKMQSDLLAQGIALSQMKQQVKEMKDQLNTVTKMIEQVLVRQDEAKVKPKAKASTKPRGRPRKKE